jgi:hypothetical protein
LLYSIHYLTFKGPLITKYGLKLEFDDTEGHMRIHISQENLNPSTTGTIKPHRLRIFPDWQTSFLWYDPKALPTPDVETEIEHDNIARLYPTLEPFFSQWRQTYQSAFQKQQCHLGSGAEVFDDQNERIVWETEGVLTACWLALQSGVDAVEYSPFEKKYVFEKADIDATLTTTLGEIGSLLGRELKSK